MIFFLQKHTLEMKIKENLKERINKIESSLLTYYENPQLKARDEKMETLIFNRRMLLNQLFKPTDENYRLLKEFNETLKEVVIKNYQQSKELYYNTKKCWQIVEVVCCLRL